MCIRSVPRYISDKIQDMHHIESKIWSDPRYISDWIQDMYQTGSKISFGTPVQCVSPALSLVPASAFVTWPSCHAPLSHANVKACREMWQNVTTCHDVVTCHGMSFRAPASAACCHSSWYLLSLTLVIGYVTVDELHEPRLYIINMKLSFRPRSYREMRVFLLLLNTESRFCSFSSPTITYSVKIWRSRSLSWNDAYPLPPLCLSRLIFIFLIFGRWYALVEF